MEDVFVRNNRPYIESQITQKNSHSLFTAAAADNALAPVDLQSLCVSGFLCNCTCSRLKHCCYWVYLSGALAHFLVRVYVVRSHAVHLNVVVNNF